MTPSKPHFAPPPSRLHRHFCPPLPLRDRVFYNPTNTEAPKSGTNNPTLFAFIFRDARHPKNWGTFAPPSHVSAFFGGRRSLRRSFWVQGGPLPLPEPKNTRLPPQRGGCPATPRPSRVPRCLRPSVGPRCFANPSAMPSLCMRKLGILPKNHRMLRGRYGGSAPVEGVAAYGHP